MIKILIHKIKSKCQRLNYLCRNWYKRFVYCSKVPIKLDIHVAEHCNLNCAGCTHYSPIAEKEFCDEKILDRSLAKLSKFERSFGAIQLLGGEPLLNPRLPEIIELTRRHFKNTRINILTNGLLLLHPELTPPHFWRVCRDTGAVIKLTHYPIKIDWKQIRDVCTNHGVNFELFKDKSGEKGWSYFYLYEEGSNYVSYKIPLLRMARCGSQNCLQLVDDKIFPCSHSAYVRHLNKTFNTKFEHKKGDFIYVDKIKHTYQFRKLMLLATPFCKYCGSGYVMCRWKISNRTADEWIAGR